MELLLDADNIKVKNEYWIDDEIYQPPIPIRKTVIYTSNQIDEFEA